MQVIHEGNEKTLERKVDKELADLGVKPYVYHIRAYGEGSQQKLLRLFNQITIVDTKKMAMIDVEYIVGELIEELKKKLRMFARSDLHPATWMMRELQAFDYYGIAICDRRDNFSRKRGRIIAKGRLLKYLRSRPVMMYGRNQRFMIKGEMANDRIFVDQQVAPLEGPELPDGTKW